MASKILVKRDHISAFLKFVLVLRSLLCPIWMWHLVPVSQIDGLLLQAFLRLGDLLVDRGLAVSLIDLLLETLHFLEVAPLRIEIVIDGVCLSGLA